MKLRSKKCCQKSIYYHLNGLIRGGYVVNAESQTKKKLVGFVNIQGVIIVKMDGNKWIT